MDAAKIKKILDDAMKAARGFDPEPTHGEMPQFRAAIAINGELKYEALVRTPNIESLIASTEEKFGGKVLMVYPANGEQPLTLGVYTHGAAMEQVEHEAAQFIAQQKELN